MGKKIKWLVFLICLCVPNIIFANTTPAGVAKASPIQFEDGEYLRITQPIKDKLAVFDRDVNVTGEARYKTVIQMQIFNKRENERIYPRNPYITYNLDAVGISQTFNELIQLQHGDNKVRFIYSYGNNKNELVEGRIVIYITRKSEQEKEALKNLRIDNTKPFTGGTRK